MVKKACALLLVGVMVASMAVSMVACDKTEIAATINGVDISESKITDRIMVMRNSNPGYAEDAAWAQALAAVSLTPESLREASIDHYASIEIVRLKATELGLSVDPANIDAAVASGRQRSAAVSDADWHALLNTWGYPNEEDYRLWLEFTTLRSMIAEVAVPVMAPPASQLQEYVIKNAAVYAGKRSSLILLVPKPNESNDALALRAQVVLDRLGAGEDFASLAKEFSQDILATNPGGDVGWDRLNGELDDAYRDALSKLDVGQISGLVKTSFGICIIKCTDEFSLTESGTIDYNSVPEEIVLILSAQLERENQDRAMEKYVDELKAAATLTINPMPKNLPYDVDMTLAE